MYFIKKLPRKYTVEELFPRRDAVGVYEYLMCFKFLGKDYPIGMFETYKNIKASLIFRRLHEPTNKQQILDLSDKWVRLWPELAKVAATVIDLKETK